MRCHARQAGWSAEEIERAVTEQGQPLPRVDFVSHEEHCPSCDDPLNVCKTRTRTVVSLAHGRFEAHEVLKRCAHGAACPTIGSEELRRLVPPRQGYAYDLIVHVGLARYLGNRQREEIRAELWNDHRIEVSAGTVSNLCDRFLLELERLHLHRVPALREAMEGGYPMHLDATCERGRGGLFAAMDGWRGWVLGATRIPSEAQDHLQPLIDKTVALFGDPLAIVRDLGDGIAAAVRHLRERGIPDLACHYHFLKSVGIKLLDDAYGGLRHALKQVHVRADLRAMLRELRRYLQNGDYHGPFGPGRVREELAALVLWLLEGEGRKGLVFPFGLPNVHLVRRCEQAMEQAEQWVPATHTVPERRVLQKLGELRRRMCKRDGISETIGRLDEGWRVFSELRDVLRITNAELPRPDARHCEQHLPQLELLRLAEIERDLLQYKQDLDQRVADDDRSSPHAVVLTYLQTYGAQLFGHPARRDDEGRVIAVVHRTNNPIEHLFGRDKQKLRRRLGRANLARDLQQQPAQAALTANLARPDYVRVVCGSLDNLASAFASLHGVAVDETTPLHRDHRDHRLHRCIRQLVESSGERGSREADEHQCEPSPQSTRESAVPLADVDGLSEEQLRARCASVFAPAPAPRRPKRRTPDPRPKGRRKPKSVRHAYPLGDLAQKLADELARADYSASTTKLYLCFAQLFADHHKRSPVDMGRTQVVEYLLHLADNANIQLVTWRTYRNALRAIYAVALHRPDEVEHIPAHPDQLRLLLEAPPVAA